LHSPQDHAAPAPPSSAGAAFLFAAASIVLAAVVVAGAAGAVLVLTGRDRVSTSTGPAPLLALGAFACAAVATLLVLNRGLHPAAVVACWLLAAAWPLGGLPFAVPAVAAIAVVAHVSGGRDLYGPPAVVLALATLGLLIAAAATAQLHDTPQPRSARSPVPAHNPQPPNPQPPSETPAARPSPTAAGLVRGYYADLDARDFRGAWARLSPAVRAEFGGFEGWRNGFARTLSSRPLALSVTGDTVRLELIARDRAACGGEVTSRFAVEWRLERTPAGRRAAAVTATALAATRPECG
jgi:hypothetical protein